jgi:hypothetical protein
VNSVVGLLFPQPFNSSRHYTQQRAMGASLKANNKCYYTAAVSSLVALWLILIAPTGFTTFKLKKHQHKFTFLLSFDAFII